MNIVHESDIIDALPTIGICQVGDKEYLYVWYSEQSNDRWYIYTPLISRAVLQEKDMYSIYMQSTERYTGKWGSMQEQVIVYDDMLPMPGEYYNEGEANTS